ncbi:hypothetical protein EAO70_15075 [Streptomyces sp. adm13(2018)]|nr:hypothetical protein EAO70_15075 [Streptomyces sp. adm13(2018)]
MSNDAATRSSAALRATASDVFPDPETVPDPDTVPVPPPAVSVDLAGSGSDAAAGSGAVSAVGSVAVPVDVVSRDWGGTTEEVAGESSTSRPNTLRSMLRIPMGEPFRMSGVRVNVRTGRFGTFIPGQGGHVRLAATPPLLGDPVAPGCRAFIRRSLHRSPRADVRT